MTRNEARDQIVIFMCDEQKVINDRDKQALDMAIQALKQEPCEDAISREAVLEKADYTETEEGWSGYTVEVDYIKSLPPVKPQDCGTCEVGNPCIYCKHDFEPQEGSE